MKMYTQGIELRKYQRDAVRAMIAQKRGICVAPAGSGKTVIAAELVGAAIRRCYDDGNYFPKVVWVAHTREQVDQGKLALDRLALDGFANTSVFCYAANPVTIDADILIVDEAHWAGASTVCRLVDDCHGFVYGFTATPKREDGVKIEDIIGPILYTVDRQTIEAVGGVIPAEVRVVTFGKKGELEEPVEALAKQYYTSRLQWCDRQTGGDEQLKRCQYRAAVNLAIRENEERDSMIAGIVRGHADDSVIVLVDTKEHGKRIRSLLSCSRFVASGEKSRNTNLIDFKNGIIKCVICTSLIDEGFDSPVAGVLVMAGSGKAFGKIIQRTGRVLRPHESKDKGIIYDIHDVGHGMLSAQHWQRRRVYKQAGYRIINIGGAI